MAPSRNRVTSMLAAAILTLSLAGCQLAALAGGSGSQNALYKFQKNERVAVLVDIADTVTPPPTFATTLADKIAAHLAKYNAADNLVSEAAIVDLQQRDPAKFKAMSIAEIARAIGADSVLVVRLTELDVTTSDEHTVDEGFAEAYVKVVSSKGDRLYPGDQTGTKLSSHIPPGFANEQDAHALDEKMLNQLALLTGRMFHSYSLEDKDMKVDMEDHPNVVGDMPSQH